MHCEVPSRGEGCINHSYAGAWVLCSVRVLLDDLHKSKYKVQLKAERVNTKALSTAEFPGRIY